jgi:2-polyprenyl-3-methyl-5-hydroxy-6-metoxy-1,4-benzoquinol methylase
MLLKVSNTLSRGGALAATTEQLVERVSEARPSDGSQRLWEQVSLPTENIFGHTKKLELLLTSLESIRRSKRGGGLRILDVGCGNGSAITQFLGGTDDEVNAIDFHQPSIDHARKHFSRRGKTFSVCSLDSMSSDQEGFDVVVFADVLEHVEAPAEFLVQARKLLKSGGRILVTIPNGFGPFEFECALSRLPYFGPTSLWLISALKKLMLGRFGSRAVSSQIPYNHESGHVQFFSFRVFMALVLSSGLTEVSTRNLSFWCGPYTNHVLGKSRAFCRINNWIADKLPRTCVSGWFFELKSEG